MKLPIHSHTKPPRLVKKRLNSSKAIQDMLTDMTECDIRSKMNSDLSSDPNLNYDILHDHLTTMKDKHLPYKFEKFNKHKHKSNKWISYGIIRSIKTRDMMYLKFKRCNQQSVEYNTLKNNLHVFVFWRRPFERRKFNIRTSYLPSTKAI